MSDAKPDTLIDRLCALDPDFQEWDLAFPQVGMVARQLSTSMERHISVDNKLVARVERGKDPDADIAELREIFACYPAQLRGLSANCIRVAQIAERIHSKLEKLGQP